MSVRDFGVGFDTQLARGLGRGLDDLYKRAEAKQLQALHPELRVL